MKATKVTVTNAQTQELVWEYQSDEAEITTEKLAIIRARYLEIMRLAVDVAVS